MGGTLTNTGTLRMGGSSGLFLSSSKVSATALTNTGRRFLSPAPAPTPALLDVSGATTNNGSISIVIDTEELAGAVGGAGSFSLFGANLQFNSSVSAGQTITETAAWTRSRSSRRRNSSARSAVSGPATRSTRRTFSCPERRTISSRISAGTGGTLTLHDTTASLTANIQMTGVYTNSDFTLAPDSGTGTLVKFV